MKLYDIPRGSKLMLEVNGSGKLEPCTFHHLDGMYSYCTVDRLEAEKDGSGVFHLGGAQPLKNVDDHYELV